MEKSLGKRPVDKPRIRFEDIKMDVRKLGYEYRPWMKLGRVLDFISGDFFV